MKKHGLILVMATLMWGCGGEDPGMDSGVDTGTPVDTGGMVDTGTPIDGGGVDAGGGTDAGGASDAPVMLPDAGEPIGMATITLEETCPAFAACGGDIEGTWHYESICIEEAEILGPIEERCAGSEILASSGTAYGTLTVGPTTIRREIGTSVTAVVALGTGCTVLCGAVASIVESMAPGTEAECAIDAGDGRCHCSVIFVNELDETNGYTIEGGDTVVTTDKTPRTFEYCVESGGELRVREIDGEPGTSTSTME